MNAYSGDDEIYGKVVKALYRKESKNFQVLMISNPLYGLVTLTVFTDREFLMGQTINAKGAWTDHPKYGRQFKAKDWW
jgi:hypothetical protein